MNQRHAKGKAGSGMTHPLMGADLATLARVLGRAGRPRGDAVPMLAAALGSSIGRLPFSLAERGWTAARTGGRQPPAPVFIVGHWRSGTTHLYNVLSRDPRFGYVTPLATGMPWDFLLLGSMLRPLLERLVPSERLIDKVPVTPDAPQEDEIALASMQTLSFYHGIYFPRRLGAWFDRGVFFEGASQREVERWCRRMRYFVAKLTLAQGGRPLLIKNPVYSARIALLREMWPDARFIHIHRNPWIVFQSTRNFYRKLLPALALQDHDDVDIDEHVLSRYPRMMQTLVDDLVQVPRDKAVEVRFEQFEREPLAVLERIYRTLGIEGFEEVRPTFEDYLGTVDNYRKNRYGFRQVDIDRVAHRWSRFIERWEYEPPNEDD